MPLPSQNLIIRIQIGFTFFGISLPRLAIKRVLVMQTYLSSALAIKKFNFQKFKMADCSDALERPMWFYIIVRYSDFLTLKMELSAILDFCN